LIKTIKIKKKGGGTRLQNVKVLASGKYKFVKNTTKGMVRKTRAKGRLAFEKAKPRKKTNKPKKSSNRVAKKSLKSRIFGGTLGKVALGIGAASLAGVAVNMVAPQFSTIAKPAAAFIAAGPIGLISELVIDQGLLGQIGGFMGFGGPVGMVAQQEVGGL
jgi:hypothetical protein